MSAPTGAARDIFLAALDRPPADRPAYLDEACAGDAALRERVAALLRAHDEPGAFLGQPPGEPTETHRPAPESAGQVIAGKYKLLQQIGEGGMGTVWMADQTEPVKRRVAVKLIRAERGQSRTILARFEAERQAIALMDHPHIAKLLDAGTAGVPASAGAAEDRVKPGFQPEGQPFFVMELVKGVPITEYCDAHKLTIPERLRLFAQVCSAVQHAHQKGIIHRDLKPTNILVESHDGRAVPKVIDFGLAKATTGLQLSEHTLFTAFGSVMGTPLYMAPEQATFNAVDVDTRADIYALGVILYELLTGTTPLSRETVKKAALDEMLKLIREQEAPTPSSRVSSSAAAPSVAANRQTEPARLGRLVRGELDWIALKALAKERERRYESAAALAADVGRFLAHEPVAAGPPTAAYRVRKFVRRHRGPVVAAALVLLALVAGVVGTTAGLVRAEERRREAEQARASEAEQRAEAATARERAAEAADRADAVNSFLVHRLLSQADPRITPVDARLTVREVLDRASVEIDRDPAVSARPAVEVALRGILGNTYLQLGVYARAEAHLRRALDLNRQVYGADHENTLESVGDYAVVLDKLNRYDEAADLLRGLLAARGKAAPEGPKSLSARNNLAVVLMHQGRWGEAEGIFRDLVGRASRVPGFDEGERLHFVANLAWSLNSQSDDPAKVAEAVRLHREHMPDYRRVWGEGAAALFTVMDDYGASLRQSGQAAEAVAWHQKSLDGRRRVLGPDHELTLAAQNNLALALLQGGAAADAEALLRSLAERKGAGLPGGRRPFYLHNLALALRAQGRLAEAVPHAAESVALFRRDVGPTNPDTIRSSVALFDLYVLTDRWADAEDLVGDLVEAARREPGLAPALVFDLRHRLGWARLRLARYADAEPELAAGLAYRQKVQPDAWPTFNSMSLLGGALLGQKKYAEAEPLLVKGYEGLKARAKDIPPPAAVRIPEALDRLVELYAATNRPDEARKWRAERAKYPYVAPPPREAKR